MSLLNDLQNEAVKRNLLKPGAEIDAAAAFRLVRDMPYMRASNRQPETHLREWRGSCSGKHYLLKALFAELGLPAHIVAGTVELQLDPGAFTPELRDILQRTNGRFVDVHNYLLVDTPKGQMVVDATWPLATRKYGLVANEEFVLGQNQLVAYPTKQTWIVPDDVDPQAFKDKLLREHFTPEELATRDAFIETFSQLLADVAG